MPFMILSAEIKPKTLQFFSKAATTTTPVTTTLHTTERIQTPTGEYNIASNMHNITPST